MRGVSCTLLSVSCIYYTHLYNNSHRDRIIDRSLIRGRNWRPAASPARTPKLSPQPPSTSSDSPFFTLPARLLSITWPLVLSRALATMPPRLALSSLCRPPVFSVRVTVARYSTAPDDAVIKTHQVPAPGSGNIRVLLLNRPKARNALSRSLLDSLAKHVQSIAAEGGVGPTRALVIASNSDAAFCAGADLKERVDMTKQE